MIFLKCIYVIFLGLDIFIFNFEFKIREVFWVWFLGILKSGFNLGFLVLLFLV